MRALLITAVLLAGCQAPGPVCHCSELSALKEQVVELRDELQVSNIDNSMNFQRLMELESAVEHHNARLAEIERYVPQELKELRYEDED